MSALVQIDADSFMNSAISHHVASRPSGTSFINHVVNHLYDEYKVVLAHIHFCAVGINGDSSIAITWP